jgi:hypothetical protein
MASKGLPGLSVESLIVVISARTVELSRPLEAHVEVVGVVGHLGLDFD